MTVPVLGLLDNYCSVKENGTEILQTSHEIALILDVNTSLHRS